MVSPDRDSRLEGRQALRPALELIGPALLYALAVALGPLASTHRGNVSPLWPATGVALWMTWRYGARALPLIALGAFVVTLPTSAGVAARIGMAFSAALEAWAAVMVLKRLRFQGALDTPRDALALIGPAALGSTALGAAVGVASLCAAGDAPWMNFAALWRTWWVGDALGDLVVAPVLLAWSEPRLRRHSGSALEFAALMVVSAGAALAAYAGVLTHTPALVNRFLAFPALVWAAMRFGPREATLAMLTIATVATGVLVLGAATASPSITEALIQLQIFIAVLAVTGLLIVAASESRRAAQRNVRGTLSLLQATLDSTADGILVVDREGGIRTYNRRFAELWGLPEEVLSTRDDRRALEAALGSLKDPASFLARVEELYARPEAESFDRIELLDGRTFERFSLPQREGGRIVGRVWSFRDVSQRMRMEEELRQLSKLEAIGRLAGGVAHEYNNLLTVILGHGELLASSPSVSTAEKRKLEEIQRAAERAAILTRQLLAFGRRQQLAPRVLDLNDVVRETEPLLHPLTGEIVELRLDLAPELGAVRADPGQMQQIVLNLALNARDAMPRGGRLTVRTYRHTLVDDELTRELGLAPGPYVVLSVQDTGIGMDAATREHLFEPFFTTKEPGGNAGLGLAMVYGVVKQSEGGIRVTSEPGAGSMFHVYLPLVGDVVAEGRRDPAPPPSTAPGDRGLLRPAACGSGARRTLAGRGIRGYLVARGHIDHYPHRRSAVMSVNKVILVGNLGANPEMRFTQGGQAVANLRLATSEKWTDKSGQKQETTEWHRVVAFGKLAEICGQYLTKGRQIYVEGRIQTRQWQDQQGQKRYSTEIVMTNMQMLGGRAAGAGGERTSDDMGATVPPADDSFGQDVSGGPDDDIPF